MTEAATSNPPVPEVTDRATWQARIDDLRVKEKAHTRAGGALATERRRLPMVEVDPTTKLIGSDGPVPLFDILEGRAQLFAKYMMWYDAAPAADQCEGCTKDTMHVRELSYLHSRDVTFAVFCQGPFPVSDRYREFMGWEMPWYSVPETSRDALDRRVLPARRRQSLRDLLDHWPRERADGQLTPDARHDRLRPPGTLGGLPRRLAQGFGINAAAMRTEADGSNVTDRPIAQWSRIRAGRNDDLGTAPGDHSEQRCNSGGGAQ